MSEPVSPIPQASPPPSPTTHKDKAGGAAQDFEAIFISQMAKLMFESVEQGDGFSGGHGEEIFRGVLAEKIGEQVAKGRGIGIADQVMAEIIKLQQAAGQGER